MNDPQNDIPCTECKTEGPRSRLDDGLCPDCQTPAGRLVTALGVLGIKAAANDEETVTAAGFIGAMIDGDNEWTLYRIGADLEAADAIAAIVQAPGLRAERDALAARVKELEAAVIDVADELDETGRVLAAVTALRDLAGGAS
jgi:hypothetical protein